MNPYRFIFSAMVAAAMFATMLLLTGCETLQIGFATDYGTLSYELPRPTSSK